MLRALRNQTKSIFFKCFLVLLICGFALWGVGDLTGKNTGKTVLKHEKNVLKHRKNGLAQAQPGPGLAWPEPGPGLAQAQVGPEETFKNHQNRLKRGRGGSVWAQTLSKRRPEAQDHFPSPPGPNDPIKKLKKDENDENPDFSRSKSLII